MPHDDREKPVLVTVLNLLGWFAIFGAVGMAVVRSGYYTSPVPALAWTQIISTAVGGIVFLTFAGIIRGLHRIEQAIRETRATPLAAPTTRARAGLTRERLGNRFKEGDHPPVRMRTSSLALEP